MLVNIHRMRSDLISEKVLGTEGVTETTALTDYSMGDWCFAIDTEHKEPIGCGSLYHFFTADTQSLHKLFLWISFL